jgi:hypothetical protein
MKPLLSSKDVIAQSNAVFNQFGESKWIPYAKANAKLPRRPSKELANKGVGRFLVCAAMGESLEDAAPLLRAYRDRIDIVTNDKCFGPLLDHGVKADYVILCDCNILFDHIKGYLPETKGVKLLATPYANVEWTQAWQGERYFFINKDAIQTERHFTPLFGEDTRIIPAGSNVSNAMLTYFLGIDNETQINFSAYEKFLAVGFDYSWRPKGNYYAWANPAPKRFYMNHRTLLDIRRDLVFTSENLFFSAKWLVSYVNAFRAPVVNCSGRGLLAIPLQNSLEAELKMIHPDTTRRAAVRRHFDEAVAANKTLALARESFQKSREDLYQWPSETTTKHP